MNESELYELAVKHWGERPQLLKTVEELSELSRAISRFLIITQDQAVPKDHEHYNYDLRLMEIYHEIVDVEIMIGQLKHNFQRDAIYQSTREVKFAHLRRLLKLEGEDV
jgi:hypothetical protein